MFVSIIKQFNNIFKNLLAAMLLSHSYGTTFTYHIFSITVLIYHEV